MANSSTLSVGDNFTEDTTYGIHSWINPDGALSAKDGQGMAATALGGAYGIKTQTYGFSLGAGVTSIDGIAVTVTAKDSCLAQGTMVRLADGNDASIEKLEVGDILAGFNEDLTEASAKVTAIKKAQSADYYVIKTDFHEVKATGTHPFFTDAKNFIPVAQLKVGDKLYTSRSRLSHTTNQMWQMYALEEIQKIEYIQKPITVYDLTVDGPHTFIANSYWVHNKGAGTIGAHHVFVVTELGYFSVSDLGDPENLFTTSYVDYVYGGPSESWGESWSQADIENANFGSVWFTTGEANSVMVDYISMTVYYTEVSGKRTFLTLTGVGK